MLRAFFSIERCLSLVQSRVTAGKTYKFVIFARPDVVYSSYLPRISEVVSGSHVLGTKFVDRFAVGGLDAIRVWASRMDSALEYIERGNLSHVRSAMFEKTAMGLHAENLLLYHLRKFNIHRREMRGFCFNRVRANGLYRKDCPG